MFLILDSNFKRLAVAEGKGLWKAMYHIPHTAVRYVEQLPAMKVLVVRPKPANVFLRPFVFIPPCIEGSCTHCLCYSNNTVNSIYKQA